MKHFAVEVKRTSYVTIHVEADTKEQAEALAWAEIESGESYGISDDANWEVEDIGPFDTQKKAIDYAAIDGVDESHVEALWVPETQGQNHEHA
jgi:hypothetical protein